MGIYGDTIHGIYFNAASAISGRPMKIWVGNTNLTDLSTSSYVPSDSMTLVFDSVYNITAGWNYFPFNTDFIRTAGSNMVVMAYDSADYDSFNGWRASNSPVNSLYAYDDNEVFNGNNLSGLESEAARSIIRLEASMLRPTCIAPAAVVAGVTGNSITVAWTAGLNETSWNVAYRAAADSVWTVLAAATTDTFATANGLASASRYVFRIGSICGTDTMYTTLTGSTECGAFTVPYTEDFNSMPANDYVMNACWVKGTTGTGSAPYTVNVSGAGMMSVMPRGSYIIFPSMDLPVNNLQLRMRFTVADLSIYSVVGVCSYPGDIYTFTPIDTIWGIEAGTPAWVTVSFENHVGDGQIAIWSTYNQSYVDDINIEIAPLCKPADSIVVSDITTTSATISWAHGLNGTAYLVDYWDINDPTNVTTLNSTGTSVGITGLHHSTSYQVAIRTICGVLGDTSLATNPTTFISGCDALDSIPYIMDFDHCNAPALTYTGILPNCWTYTMLGTGSYATDTYLPQIYSGTSYAHSGQYSLRLAGNAIVLLPEMPTSVTSTSSSGLIIGVCDSNTPGYEASFVPVDTLHFTNTHTDVVTYALASYAGTGRYIALRNYYINSTSQYSYHYIDDLRVDYLPNCLPVLNVHAAASSSTSVNLTWTDLRPSTEWEISYGTSPMADPSTGTVVNTTSHPYLFSGLSDSNVYYFYVRNICGAGDTSAWSTVFSCRPGTWVMRPNQTDTISMCGGTIYDDGGENGSYSNSQNSYLVLMPDGSNLVSVSGTVNTESCCDSLVIYDGIGTSSSNRLWGGKGTGLSFANLVSSTGPLTIFFHCDGSINNSGYEIHVSCVSNACPISNIHVDESTTTGTTIAWTGTSSDYDVEYGAGGFTLGTGTRVNTTTNSITLTGLAGLTNYDVYIRGYCSPDSSRWFHFSFQTPMCDNVVMVENWDSTMTSTSSSYSPIGYSFYNYSYVQTIIDSADLAVLGGDITALGFKPASTTAGTYFTNMDVYLANVSQSTLSSSSFITPSATTPFVHVISSSNFSYSDTDWQIHGFDSTFTWDGHSNVLVAVNRRHGSYSSGASFRAHNHGTGNTKMCYAYTDSSPYSITNPGSPSSSSNIVGDIRLYSCGASCAAPVVNVTNVDYQGATVTAVGSSSAYELVYGTDINALGDTMTSTTGSFTLTGLTPEIQYIVGVRQQCDSATWSNWTITTFTTDSLPCFDPDSVDVVATSFSSVTLHWISNGSATQWVIRTIGAGVERYDTVGTNPATVRDLYAGQDYSAAVKAICLLGVIESDWSAPITFRTDDCLPVEGVTVGDITTNSAVASWDATNGALGYRISYGEYDFIESQATRVEVPANATSYTFTGLEENFHYEFYVQTKCGDGLYSAVSAEDRVEFNTLESTEGIYDVETGTLTLYPNPASSNVTLTVNGFDGEVTVEIVDLNGKLISEHRTQNSELTIDVTSMAQGAYFVRVTGERQTAVRKLIVR